VDPLSIPQPRTGMGAPSSAMPARPQVRPVEAVGAVQSIRLPSLVRRLAAVLVGVLLLTVVAASVDFERAMMVLLLFALFLFLWPSWPQRTAGEQRAAEWPFAPNDR
jgi:hypothetical protein